MIDKLEKLKLDYIKNVLPYLYKFATEKSISGLNYRFSGNSFHIELDFESIRESAPEYKPRGSNFIHFTSLRSLHSVLNEQAIRMYDLSGMNDPNEFEMIAKDFGYERTQLDSVKKSTHIFSMCPIDVLDSKGILNLWRLYGDEGSGCAIEFEIKCPISSFPEINLAPINYSIPDYTSFFKANREFEERHNIEVDLKGLIQMTSCLHKSEQFEVENEVRLISINSKLVPILSSRDDYKYRYDFNRRNNIVSYRKVKLYGGKDADPNIEIKRIQFGFKFTDEQVKEFEKHISQIFEGIMLKLGRMIQVPIIERSPLVGVFD